MTNNRSLQRIFSNFGSGKYPTVGKFLPSVAKQQTVLPVAAPKAAINQSSSGDEDLDLLDNLINQTISNRALASTSNDVPYQSTPRAKEFLANENQSQVALEDSAESLESVSEQAQESPEVASSPEIVELSKEIKEVSKESKEQREEAMIKERQQEINNLAASVTTPVAVSDKPVVILPITKKSKEEAKFKSTKYSVKWLVEWCIKIAKMFSGAVIYKEEIADE